MTHPSLNREDLLIPCGSVDLSGTLQMPADGCHALVLFVHGSGSSRHSPRNQFVAQRLQGAGMGTLLFDLLTPEEELRELHTGHLRFDIKLLSQRLETVTEWLNQWLHPHQYEFGFFGASTGAAAALTAAASMGHQIKAVVSRGGRPDLALPILPQVRSPTLFIVGAADRDVVGMNLEAMRHMRPDLVRIELIEGASHLFEEAGALEQVADLARDWFESYLMPGTRTEADPYAWTKPSLFDRGHPKW